MPRDYVRSRSKPTSSGSASGVVWLLTGVFIGLIIAGIFYIKNQHHPKSSEVTVPAATPSKTAADVPIDQQSAKNPAKPGSTQNLQAQFDFYNVLPSKKIIGPSGDEDTSEIQNDQTQIQNTTTSPAATPPQQTPQSLQQASPPPAPVVLPPSQKPLSPVIQATPAPSVKPVLPPPASATKSGEYIVQVAALSEASDADELKAQLTLLGFNVKVTTSPPKNGKTYHRVWLGTFHTLSEAESIQKQLQENMISSKVLKSPQ